MGGEEGGALYFGDYTYFKWLGENKRQSLYNYKGLQTLKPLNEGHWDPL